MPTQRMGQLRYLKSGGVATHSSFFEELKFQAQLYGFISMEPKYSNQALWAQRLEPNLKFEGSPWEILQKYTMPLIYRHGTRAHIKGITKLKLNEDQQPSFNKIQESDPNKFHELLKLYWILLEYGLVKANGEIKVFGAAFVGSFMALKRLELNYISMESFNRRKALNSGLYEENRRPKRTWGGKIQFYYLDSIDELMKF